MIYIHLRSTTYQALFSLRLRHLQNMGFPHFFFDVREQTVVIESQVRAIWHTTHQFDVLSGQKGAGLSRCGEHDLLLFVFRISPKTLGKQIVVYHSELTDLRCSSGTLATLSVLPKKQTTVCFEVLLTRTTFIGFGSFSKAHTMDCCFVSGSYV